MTLERSQNSHLLDSKVCALHIYVTIISGWGYTPLSLEFLDQSLIWSCLWYFQPPPVFERSQEYGQNESLSGSPHSTSCMIKHPLAYLTYLNSWGSCIHWSISSVQYNFYGCKVQSVTHSHLKIPRGFIEIWLYRDQQVSLSCALGNSLQFAFPP